MINAKDKGPWYRQPWPWILMAGPAIAIVAGAITFYFAVVSNDGLVEEDYYAQGMRINETSAREKNALALGVQAELMQSASEPAQASATPAKLRIFLRANAGISLPQLEKDAVAYIAQNPARLTEYAIATFQRSVFLSSNAGKSWTLIADRGEGRTRP